VDIAEAINIAPCLLARLIIQCHLGLLGMQEANSNVKSEVSKRIKDPSLIEDERLKNEVEKCIACDDNYSPLVEKIRRSTGIEYEYILQEKLRNLNVPFLSEDEMREKGYPKTPDIKLQIPLLINGHVVNWIDSKASFGDDYSHKLNIEQFWGYKNRYGPGMVIYWFGFIDDLQFDQEAGILLVDHFPSTIIKLSDQIKDKG